MNINNPTPYILRKIHSFDLINAETNERVPIDVIEYFDREPRRYAAIPHYLGYNEDKTICGVGDSIELALNDCLKKASSMSWSTFCDRARGPLPKAVPTI